MEVKASKPGRSAWVSFGPEEWLRIELYAEKCGLKVGDVVESVIKHGYKDFFQRANST